MKYDLGWICRPLSKGSEFESISNMTDVPLFVVVVVVNFICFCPLFLACLLRRWWWGGGGGGGGGHPATTKNSQRKLSTSNISVNERYMLGH